MNSLEILNSQAHAGLRLSGAAHPNSHFIRIVASEFAAAAACCPVLLSKNRETGEFYAGALMGFKAGETLVDSPDGKPAFRPLELEREGFFASGENISVDLAHPRMNQSEGSPLFDTDGEPGPALRRIQGALGRLMAGRGETNLFLQALLAHRLIEPIDLTLNFDDGERLSLKGLYTVSLDGLHELDDIAAITLFRKGHLQLAYTMIASLQQISVLARRRNDRLVHDM